MKTRTIGIFSALLLALLLVGNASASQSHHFSLLNTTWTGDLTVVNTDGSTTPVKGVSLTFTTETDDFLSGTITGLAAEPIAFSAIKDGRSLRMTAVNIKMFAELERGHHGRGWHANPAILDLQGSNFADGSMFEGDLTLQTTSLRKKN